jgi:hypothetical protein
MLRYPNLPENAHIRTCQECGHAQVAHNPDKYKSDIWRDLKCSKCKSAAMDFGSVNSEVTEDEN